MTTRAVAVLLFLVGCGASGAHTDDARTIEPALVEPRVPVEDVGDRLGAVQTANADRIAAYLEEVARPGQLRAADRAEIVQAGDRHCWSLPFADAHKIAFVQRRGAHWWAAAMPMGPDGRPVPSLTWMGAAINVNRAAPDDLATWYREMSRRVATSGRASGILLDDDLGATGIVIELRMEPDQGDAELVTHALVMRPAEFDAQRWGPALPHTWGGYAMTINGRAGVSICDLLSMRPF